MIDAVHDIRCVVIGSGFSHDTVTNVMVLYIFCRPRALLPASFPTPSDLRLIRPGLTHLIRHRWRPFP